VLVTHDQNEALSMADDVAVMRDGRIVQGGPPADVYTRPTDPWVAAFVGESVWLTATIDGTVAKTALGAIPVVGEPGGARILLRPEQINVSESGVDHGANAVVVRQDFFGHDALLGLQLSDGTEIMARTVGPAAPPVGAVVGVGVHGAGRSFKSA